MLTRREFWVAVAETVTFAGLLAMLLWGIPLLAVAVGYPGPVTVTDDLR
jgi:hypothetical protein